VLASEAVSEAGDDDQHHKECHFAAHTEWDGMGQLWDEVIFICSKPSANVSMAAAVNAGLFRSWRRARRKSSMILCPWSVTNHVFILVSVRPSWLSRSRFAVE
jgi:hypothetical protein